MANIDLVTLGYAVLGGMVPTFIWLWFWLRNDDTDDTPEPRGLIALCFIAGIMGVLVILPLEYIINWFNITEDVVTIIYATTEEIVKYGLVSFVAFRSRFLDQPLDYVTYLVTGALGFAALENTLYLIDPIASNDVASVLVTSNLRFLGATVLHSLMGATMGVLLGFVFYYKPLVKFFMTIFGLLTISTLHVVFNFFIMNTSSNTVIVTLGVLWTFGVIVLLLVQRIKKLQPPIITH